MNRIRFVYEKKISEDVDIDRLVMELIELSRLADLNDANRVIDLLSQLDNRSIESLYAVQVGFKESLVVALSIIRDVVVQNLKTTSILDAAMSNVAAWRLGEIASQAGDPRLKGIGDPIDRGLVLRRLLEEKGFGIVLLPFYKE